MKNKLSKDTARVDSKIKEQAKTTKSNFIGAKSEEITSFMVKQKAKDKRNKEAEMDTCK